RLGEQLGFGAVIAGLLDQTPDTLPKWLGLERLELQPAEPFERHAPSAIVAALDFGDARKRSKSMEILEARIFGFGIFLSRARDAVAVVQSMEQSPRTRPADADRERRRRNQDAGSERQDGKRRIRGRSPATESSHLREPPMSNERKLNPFNAPSMAA